ncbi:MAG TPA: glycosyltransferase [Chitinophagales bacterium]|nr:glycosyltransferase [Chitinophagales bacterium]
MNPLNIVQVIDVFDDARNGAVISTQRFTTALRQKGHQVKVISTGKKSQDKIIMPEFYPPVPFVKNVMQKMKTQFAFPDEKKINSVIETCDIVHVQFPFWLSMKCIEIAQQYKKPIVSTFHVQAEQIAYNINIKNKWLIKKINQFFIEQIYNKSDVVICPSIFAQDELKRYGLKTNSVVISNGIMKENFLMSNRNQGSPYFHILTVGRNAVEKRQDMLIEAISKCKNKKQIKLSIIGDGPIREKLTTLANNKLPNQVEFLYVSKDEITRYYQEADLYVHCAGVEVESMSTMEAMAAGLPMIIADAPLSAAKQFALNSDFLFKTTTELTHKIDYYFEHSNELQQAAEKYALQAKKYAFDISVNQLTELYYSLQ